MKNLLLIFMYACFSACSFNRAPADFFNSGESNDLLKQVKATKLLNTYDEEACNVYIIEPGRNCPKAKIKKTVDRADKIEGDGSFSLKYNFSGKPEDGEKESVYVDNLSIIEELYNKGCTNINLKNNRNLDTSKLSKLTGIQY